MIPSNRRTIASRNPTTKNTSDYVSRIDDPRINGNRNALLTVSQNWNPGGVGGIYNEHPIGLWYGGGHWYVMNQDFAA